MAHWLSSVAFLRNQILRITGWACTSIVGRVGRSLHPLCSALWALATSEHKLVQQEALLVKITATSETMFHVQSRLKHLLL